MCVIMGLPWILVIEFWGEAFLLLFRQPPEIAALSSDYMEIVAFGYIPVCMSVVCRSFMVSLGRTWIPLVIILLALLMNACLDYVLIFGKFGMPALGLRGSALASFFVAFLILAAYVVVLINREPFRAYQVFKNIWNPDWGIFFKVLRLGIPISISILIEESLLLASALLIGSQNSLQLAAHGIALELVSLVFMLVIGLTDAAVVRVGYAFGARDWNRVRPAGWSPFFMTFSLVALGSVIMLAFPSPLAHIFLDPTLEGAQESLMLSQKLLLIAALFLLFDGVQIGIIGALHGLSDMLVPMWGYVLGMWGFGLVTGAVLSLGFGYGVFGLWSGLSFGVFICALFFIIRFYRISSPDSLKKRAEHMKAQTE